MATFSSQAYFPITNKLSSNKASYDPNKKSLNNIKINIGTFTKSTTKVDMSISSTSFTENGYISHEQQVRQNISTTKESVDHYRQGMIIEGGVGYRQRVVIRSHEVGPDKTATLESILNLLQETALNHVWMSGLHSDEFGATHGMMKNDLIWVMSRMPRVQVDRYPVWGEVLEIDTWVGASGKNGMRRDWLIRSEATGHVYARATSTWVMNDDEPEDKTPLKMPEEVRAENAPYFIEKQAITEEVENVVELDSKAECINKDLKPKRSDLDMSDHVSNVNYVRWMLETIPDQILEAHQLIISNVLEHRREWGSSDIVQSLCRFDDDGILKDGLMQEKDQLDDDGILKDGQNEDNDTCLINGFFLGEFKGSIALQIILNSVGISLRALFSAVLIVVALVSRIRNHM